MITRNLEEIMRSVEEFDISAVNDCKTQGTGVCMTFVQLPETSRAILAITVMNKGVKKTALPPSGFMRMMNIIEGVLSDLQPDHPANNALYYTNHNSDVPKNWLAKLNCHRFFVLPNGSEFDLLRLLSKKSKLFDTLPVDELKLNILTKYSNVVAYIF